MTSMTLAVNERALVSNLRQAFTDNTQFISELLQNARRAGATRINITSNADQRSLTVEDNGHGIEDFQNLLSVAHSGWNQTTKSSETPYGMGFLAALFAAEAVIIESRGKLANFETAEAIGFEPINVIGKDTTEPGTRITLLGLEEGLFNLSTGQLRVPRAYLDGFPCEVILDGGNPVERPHALDGELTFTDTPFGRVHLHGLTDGHPTMDTSFYLQGQLVDGLGLHRRLNCNVVHLDPHQFKGRLPDRDCLLGADRKEAQAQFTAWFDQEWRGRLQADKKKLTAEAFINTRLHDLEVTHCRDLLNDLPLVPRLFLMDNLDYPVQTWNWESEGEQPRKHLSREDVEKGRVRVVMLDGICEDQSMAAHNLVYLMENVMVLDSLKLASDHWLREHLIKVEPADITIEVDGVERVCEVCGTGGYYPPAVFCQSITLKHPVLGQVTTESVAMLLRADEETVVGVTEEDVAPMFSERSAMIAVPAKTNNGIVVRQVYSFEDEFDTPNEDYCEQEKAAFSRFIMASRPGRELEAIKAALLDAGLNNLDSLRGTRFEVSFGQMDTEHKFSTDVCVKAVK